MIKNNINKLLDSKKITIYKISNDLDTRYATMHDLVNREDLSKTRFDILVKISRYLDCSVEDLFEYVEGDK
ncbi:helix-turn-helix domain-containing protein [Miniphocaeibacter massiliensis]|uniref:helix-turn-helix domain-containing protein n=1 Tax=Miniphocaeibacter massiliensis TaxID=2041841 RepID=UPI00101AEC69|nr:helix-turn-helix transcriptional regulator [Miniphocaeibacter massiliensis]